MSSVGRCRSCKARIRWCVTANGKRMPVDVEPVADGNVQLWHDSSGELHAIVLTGFKLDDARRQHPLLYRSHFVSCPDAATHRKSPAERSL